MSYFVIIRGPLGSGKTTIAKKLSEKINAEYIVIDRILDEYTLTDEKEDGYISQKSFLKANAIVLPKAKKLIKEGTPVIFDGNFYWKSQLDDLIQKMDAPHHVFTLKVPLEVCIERDKNREKSHGKDAAEAVYKKSTEFTYGVEIDGVGSEEGMVNELLGNIARNNWIYLDTCIISGLVKGDLKQEEKTAFRDIYLTNHFFCTSEEAKKEINKIPEQFRDLHLSQLNLFWQLPEINKGDSLYLKLKDVLPDENDILHIYQAESRKIKFFLTVDYKSILKHKNELQKFLFIKFYSPVEFVEYLGQKDNLS